MGILDLILSRHKNEKDCILTQGVIDFLEGRKNFLIVADVYPDFAKKYRKYELAMTLKKVGDFEGAVKLLIQSCEPPSIYKGHYQELFLRFGGDKTKRISKKEITILLLIGS